jgi:hypothetical protein
VFGAVPPGRVPRTWGSTGGRFANLVVASLQVSDAAWTFTALALPAEPNAVVRTRRRASVSEAPSGSWGTAKRMNDVTIGVPYAASEELEPKYVEAAWAFT